MTLQEIIDLTRRRLDNYEPPYDWTDAELVDYVNYAIEQIARKDYFFDDSYTPSVCNITTVDGTIDYLLSTDIVELKSMRVTGEVGTVTQTGVGLSDLSICGDYSHDNADTSFVITIDGVGSPDTFKWSDDDGATWDASTVAITGTWQELTHGIFIKFFALTGHTNADSWAFTVSYNSNQLMVQTTMKEMLDAIPSWRQSDEDIPTKYLLDYRQGYVSFYTPPDAAYLINMNVLRYPTTSMTTTAMSTQTPEIPARFHMVLIDGIMYQAYNKTGVETYNSEKADRHWQFFRLGINDILINKIISTNGKRSLTPHFGTL
jgi:hypothetical protein